MASSENLEQKLINFELTRLMNNLISCRDKVDKLDEILDEKHFNIVEIKEKLQNIIFAAERVLDRLQDLMAERVTHARTV